MPGFELIGEEERRAVNEVFDRGGVLFRHGFDSLRQNCYKVREFEQAFAAKLGVRYAQAVSSGTGALKVALKALGVGPGDEVITQCHTFVATVEAILECGATPVLTEINSTLNMDPDDLRSKIGPKTRAIVPVHMLGVAAQIEEIFRIANERGIPVVEDTAQALGATYRGQYLGSIGRLGTFSFDHGKILTTGEGGMVATNDEALYLRARAYHDHGHENNPSVPRGEDTRASAGWNYRMMELQGAVGLAQLAKLEYGLAQQRANKSRIKTALSRRLAVRFRELPDEQGDAGDALVFFLESREAAKAAAAILKSEGVGFKNLPDALNWHFAGTWDHIFHDVPAYRGRDVSGLWQSSEDILRRAIAVPVFIRMDEQRLTGTIDKIAGAIERVSLSGSPR